MESERRCAFPLFSIEPMPRLRSGTGPIQNDPILYRTRFITSRLTAVLHINHTRSPHILHIALVSLAHPMQKGTRHYGNPYRTSQYDLSQREAGIKGPGSGTQGSEPHWTSGPQWYKIGTEKTIHYLEDYRYWNRDIGLYVQLVA